MQRIKDQTEIYKTFSKCSILIPITFTTSYSQFLYNISNHHGDLIKSRWSLRIVLKSGNQVLHFQRTFQLDASFDLKSPTQLVYCFRFDGSCSSALGSWMVSFVGAVVVAGLQFVYPPILHILSLWDSSFGRYRWKLIKDIAIVCFGVLGCITGTAVSLMEIIKVFSA